MNPTTRGPAPELLQRFGSEITRDYVAKRALKPNHDFDWPQREGRSLRIEIREALAEMTQRHCSYCDRFPMDSPSVEQIDHFKPKSWPAFYELVCNWENLFFTCSGCNNAKLATWEPALLRPDDAEFAFDRYFEYRADTGEIKPNQAASDDDQHRANRTIELLKLNRPGLCIDRAKAAKNYPRLPSDELADWGFRFLIPICRDEPTVQQ